LAKSDAGLEILALGPLQVFVGDRVLTSSDWTYSKPRELLFYLLSHASLTKEEISLTLWPDASSVQVRRNFHVTLHHLRRVLGGTSWIIFENDHYTFNRSLSYRYDVEAFESGIAQARQMLRFQPGSIGQVIEHLEEAVGLYRGDFLQDVAVGAWAIPRREELRCLYLEALLTLGQLHLQTGNQAEAARAYRQAITCDSYLEAAHRGLMRCFARQGEPAQAVRVYKTLCQLFLDELGSPPSPETVALYEQLRRGEPV
jgi:DNA-binding SARP family transcriptional activator